MGKKVNLLSLAFINKIKIFHSLMAIERIEQKQKCAQSARKKKQTITFNEAHSSVSRSMLRLFFRLNRTIFMH